METGLTIDFDIEKNELNKPAHLHFRWAKEKCPICGSAVMILYCPTEKHEAGIGAAFPEMCHNTVFSCVQCNFLMHWTK